MTFCNPRVINYEKYQFRLMVFKKRIARHDS